MNILGSESMLGKKSKMEKAIKKYNGKLQTARDLNAAPKKTKPKLTDSHMGPAYNDNYTNNCMSVQVRIQDLQGFHL